MKKIAKKTKLKTKAMPKTIYGIWNGDGEDGFLDTAVDAASYAETGKSVRVAVYELVGYATVSNETVVTPVE